MAAMVPSALIANAIRTQPVALLSLRVNLFAGEAFLAIHGTESRPFRVPSLPESQLTILGSIISNCLARSNHHKAFFRPRGSLQPI